MHAVVIGVVFAVLVLYVHVERDITRVVSYVQCMYKYMYTCLHTCKWSVTYMLYM